MLITDIENTITHQLLLLLPVRPELFFEDVELIKSADGEADTE